MNSQANLHLLTKWGVGVRGAEGTNLPANTGLGAKMMREIGLQVKREHEGRASHDEP